MTLIFHCATVKTNSLHLTTVMMRKVNNQAEAVATLQEACCKFTLMEENFHLLPDQENEYIPIIIDKRTKECVVCRTQQPSRAGRQNASNVISNKPGVNPSCRNAATLSDTWQLFFIAELIYTDVGFTNECIRERLEKFRKHRKNSEMLLS